MNKKQAVLTSEILKADSIRIMLFWHMPPNHTVDTYQHFR
jgi:hypothetical protein